MIPSMFTNFVIPTSSHLTYFTVARVLGKNIHITLLFNSFELYIRVNLCKEVSEVLGDIRQKWEVTFVEHIHAGHTHVPYFIQLQHQLFMARGRDFCLFLERLYHQ